MFSFYLRDGGQQLEIKSIISVSFFGYSTTQFLLASDSRLFCFDLVDGINVQAEICGKMLKFPKTQQPVSLTTTFACDLEGEVRFHPWKFSSSVVRATSKSPSSSLCKQGICLLGQDIRPANHIKWHPLYFSRTPSCLVFAGHCRSNSISNLQGRSNQ